MIVACPCGHKWRHRFFATDEFGLPFLTRVVCSKCGVLIAEWVIDYLPEWVPSDLTGSDPLRLN